MSAEALFQKPDLAGALSTLKGEVASKPSDGKLRWFLFQLFAFVGEYDRAQSQLNLAAQLDKDFEGASLIYSRVMASELLRVKIASGQATPLLLGEPEPWTAKLFEANRLLGSGEVEAATALRAEVFDVMPTSAGVCGDTAFEWICDQDSRYATNFECFLNGKYYWIPFTQVLSVVLSGKPSSYTDLLYPQAKLTLRTGAELDVMLFARYPADYANSDASLALNRRTEWVDENDYTLIGRGQRMFCTDNADYSLLDLISLVFD